MAIRNEFTFSARWQTCGVDCSFCKHFRGPESWPDLEGRANCTFHQVGLSFRLNSRGYISGEAFCKNFSNAGDAFNEGVATFDKIQASLEENVLYLAEQDKEYLEEVKLRP